MHEHLYESMRGHAVLLGGSYSSQMFGRLTHWPQGVKELRTVNSVVAGDEPALSAFLEGQRFLSIQRIADRVSLVRDLTIGLHFSGPKSLPS